MRFKSLSWIFIPFLLAALRVIGAAQVATTPVTDVIYHADGTTATGTVLISWPAFTTAAGDQVPAGNTSATIAADGTLSVHLVANSGAIPVGTYYTVTYHLDDSSVTRQYWVVPQSASPVRVAAIESSVLPTSVALQMVTKSYVDTAIANAQSVDTTPLVHKAGDAMSGPLVLAADPVSSMQAATRHYVDTAVAAQGPGAGISGQTPNYVPLATSPTNSTTSSRFFDDGSQAGVQRSFGQFQLGSQCGYPAVFDSCNYIHILDNNDSTVGSTPGSLVGQSFVMNSYGGGGGKGAVESRVTLQRTDSDSQNGIDTPGIKQIDSSTQSVYGVGDIGILYHDNTVHGGMAYGADQGSQNLIRIEEISALMHGTINAGSDNRQLHITQTANCVAPLSYLCTPVPGSWLIDTTTAVAAGKGISPQTSSSFGPGLAEVATDQTTIPSSSVYGIAHNANINSGQPYENPVDTTLTFDAGVGSFAAGDSVCVLPVNQQVGFEEQSVVTSVSGSAGAQTIHLPLALVQNSPAVFKGYCMYLSFDADAAQGVRYALPAVSIDGSHIIYGYPITSTLQGGRIPASGLTFSLFDNSSRSGWHLYRGARVWKLDTTSPNFMPLNMANVITYVEPNGAFAVGDTVEAVDFPAQKIDGLDLYAGQDIASTDAAGSTALTAHLAGKGINGNATAVKIENDGVQSGYGPYGGPLTEPAAASVLGPFNVFWASDLSPLSTAFAINNHQPGQTSYQIWNDQAWGVFSLDGGGFHFNKDVFGGSYWANGLVSAGVGQIAGPGDGAGNRAGVELQYPSGYDRASTWLTPCNEVPLFGQPTTICLSSQGASRSGYSVTGDRALSIAGLFMGPNGATNSTIDFGANYGVPAIYLYHSAGNSYGWGLNSAEMQFFTPTGSGNHFSWNGGADQQPSGTEEIMRLTSISSGVGKLGLGSGSVFGFTSGSSSGALDTGLSRDSAGVIDIGNGTQGDASGTINAAHYGPGALANGMTATTQPARDNSTKVATTAYVDSATTGAATASSTFVALNPGGGTFNINAGTCTVPAAVTVSGATATSQLTINLVAGSTSAAAAFQGIVPSVTWDGAAPEWSLCNVTAGNWSTTSTSVGVNVGRIN